MSHGQEAVMENLSFWSSSRSQRLALSCGKRHIHQQNYTLSSWHWDYYCLLSTSLVPLKCWYKLTAVPLKGKKEKAWDKERAYTGQRSSLQLTGGESYQKEQSSHFLDLFKPPNYRGLRSIAVAVSTLTSGCNISTLFEHGK